MTDERKNEPLSLEAESYIQRVFPCEPPCDSFGICDNCYEKTIFGAGYNFGYRAGPAASQEKKTTLSTGVELGCWANPAKRDTLPPIEMTPEEIKDHLEKHRDEIEEAIKRIEIPAPLHQKRGNYESS